jgi:glycogen operon protein
MTEADWDAGFGRAIGVFLNGSGISETDDRGEPITDDSFLLCFSAHHEPIDFVLPGREEDIDWQLVLDTATSEVGDTKPMPAGEALTLQPRTLAVLQRIS